MSNISFLDGPLPRDDSAARPSAGGPDESAATVRLTILRAGATHAPARLFGVDESWRRVEIPALFALIEHPRYGATLFDTGYSTRFFEATRGFPDRLYRWLTPVAIGADENAGPQLARRGIPPEQIRWIVVSHFDPDHIGGLRDFPGARFVCSWRAWRAIAGKTGLAALRERLLCGLLPDDFAARLHVLPDPHGPAIGPLGPSHDLFGDGSVLLVALPGHAPGMLGAVVATDRGEQTLLCADACWTRRTFEDPRRPAGVHPLLAKNRTAQRETYRLLRRLREEMPGVQIVPSHCPETFRSLQS
jgi:glyoxylase-like metal-dependent hydrolase (beta-lactamase superfamily II)